MVLVIAGSPVVRATPLSFPLPGAPVGRIAGAATGQAGCDSVMTAMLKFPTKSNGIYGFCEKLAVDFLVKQGLCVGMEDDTAELIARLCTRIGMIMEDASVIALTIGSMDEADRSNAIARLGKDSARIDQLIDAVRALAS